jgi:hypothetical protein
MRLLAACLVLCCAAPAAAYTDDIALRSLGRPHSTSLGDPATLRFRALTSEVILALIPAAMESAETTGLSGFSYAFGLRGTKIHASADFWRGQAGSPLLEAPLAGGGVPNVLWTPALTLRKGLPLSSELSFTGSYLPHSHMAMLSGGIKLALHESYIEWLPNIAVRVTGHRLLGATDFDVTGIDFAGLISYRFHIVDALTLTPYFGYSQLYAEVTSEELDETPFSVSDFARDQKAGPTGSLYQFPVLNWASNTMPRIAAGLNVQFTMLTVLYEFSSSRYARAMSAIQSHGITLRIDT